MNDARSDRPQLLDAGEPAALEVLNEHGRSPFVMLCEHASNRVPRRLAHLGLSEQALQLHIAFDIGARDVAVDLGARLDAPVVIQNYSRLVCDCNRAVADADYIVETSDGIAIPGNTRLSAEERRLRTDEIHTPFHDAVTQLLERRSALGLSSHIVAVHSFTPALAGRARPWHVGVLYVEASALSVGLLRTLREDHALVVGDNEPYSLLITYSESMTRHGVQRGIPALEIEIRQDLLAHTSQRTAWAARLAEALRAAAMS